MLRGKKLRALLYREFRLERKNLIIMAGILAAYAGMLFAMLASVMSEDLGLPSTESFFILTALLSSMTLFTDTQHLADVKSGWAVYSYALPVTPLERETVIFVRRALSLLCFNALGLIIDGGMCFFLDIPFTAGIIVWHVLVVSGVILLGLPTSFFMLKARDATELKEMQTRAGLTGVALMAAGILVVFKAGGIDFKDLMNNEAKFRFPEFTAASLLWAVPVMILIAAADFLVSRKSLQKADMSVRKEETKTAAGKKELLKTDSAEGLLYKELKQNKRMLILTVFLPFLTTAFPFVVTAGEVIAGSKTVADMFELATYGLMRGVMFVIGINVLSAIISETFKGDDKKHWAYFVASVPNGVNKFIYRKYTIVAFMNIIYLAAAIAADNLLSTVYWFVTGRETGFSMTLVYVAGVYIMLFIAAFDIPFTMRYGSSKGSWIKTIIMLLLCTAAVSVFSFVLSEEMKQRVINIFMAVLDGKADNAVMTAIGISPYIAVGAFIGSYKISCNLFMKGVNGYAK